MGAVAAARADRIASADYHRGRRQRPSASRNMSSSKRPERVLPDEPVYRPLERFWPYADLTEQPTDAELANLHPELRTVLFGAPALPFSISVDFPSFEGPDYDRAVELARASDEY